MSLVRLVDANDKTSTKNTRGLMLLIVVVLPHHQHINYKIIINNNDEDEEKKNVNRNRFMLTSIRMQERPQQSEIEMRAILSQQGTGDRLLARKEVKSSVPSILQIFNVTRRFFPNVTTDTNRSFDRESHFDGNYCHNVYSSTFMP